MSDSPPKSIAVEYGAIRANVDIQKLNMYLQLHVPVVVAPVQVQQFKVRSQSIEKRFQVDWQDSLDRYVYDSMCTGLHDIGLSTGSPILHTF
jgi:hypothetical protein